MDELKDKILQAISTNPKLKRKGSKDFYRNALLESIHFSAFVGVPPLLVLCRAQVCRLHQQKWFALIKKYGN